MRRSRSKQRRSGTVLILTLVCLLVVTGILGAVMQGVVRARRQLHAERDLRQTEQLLRAGLDRAAFRLAGDNSYAGETWKLSSDEVTGHGEAIVTIEAKPQGKNISVQVSAEYRVASNRAIRRSQEFLVPSQDFENKE